SAAKSFRSRLFCHNIPELPPRPPAPPLTSGEVHPCPRRERGQQLPRLAPHVRTRLRTPRPPDTGAHARSRLPRIRHHPRHVTNLGHHDRPPRRHHHPLRDPRQPAHL